MRRQVGHIIRQKREALGLSQGELARRIGYKSKQFVCDWEKNRSHVPLEKIKRLAEILGINPRVLLLMCYPEITDIV